MIKADVRGKYLVPNESQIYWRIIDREIVFIDKRKREIYDLNPAGNLIWREAVKRKSIGEIINELKKKYKNTPRSVLHKDTLEFISRLVKCKIFVLRDKP